LSINTFFAHPAPIVEEAWMVFAPENKELGARCLIDPILFLGHDVIEWNASTTLGGGPDSLNLSSFGSWGCGRAVAHGGAAALLLGRAGLGL
jgi:hypothetical protein